MTAQLPTRIPFHGDELFALRGDSPATTLVAMKPLVAALGLDWAAQLKRIKRSPVLSRSMAVMAMDTINGDRDGVALRLSRLHFYLVTISTKRIPDPTMRERIIAYQEECADVLFERFFGGAAATSAGLDARQHGGITKAVVNKALEDHLTPLHERLERVEQALADQVPDRAAVPAREFVTALDYLVSKGWPQKGRRAVVHAVSARLLDFSALNGFRVRRSTEARTKLFHVDAFAAWEAAGGAAFLRARRDRLEGQGVLGLAPARNSSRTARAR